MWLQDYHRHKNEDSSNTCAGAILLRDTDRCLPVPILLTVVCIISYPDTGTWWNFAPWITVSQCNCCCASRINITNTLRNHPRFCIVTRQLIPPSDADKWFIGRSADELSKLGISLVKAQLNNNSNNQSLGGVQPMNQLRYRTDQ